MNSMDETLKTAARSYLWLRASGGKPPTPAEMVEPSPSYAVPRNAATLTAVDPAAATAYALPARTCSPRGTIVTEQSTVTVGVIAKELGVSDAKVKKAIEALKIEPVGRRGVCKLYATDVVDAVKKTLA